MRLLAHMLLLAMLAGCSSQNSPYVLNSPDGEIQVQVYINSDSKLVYNVQRLNEPVLLESHLGVATETADYTKNVTIADATPVTKVEDSYQLRVGKKIAINYSANEQTFTLSNGSEAHIQVTFRVSNDGVAFRYLIGSDESGHQQFLEETTSFRFAPDTRAWLQPMAVAKSGWNRTNPSYEEFYETDIPVGTDSNFGVGWVFPGLFKSKDNWVLLSEAGVNAHWHGSRLAHQSVGGEYTIALPEAAEVFTDGALLANGEGALVSPWRLLAIGDLATIMESTLGTDVADPAITMQTDFVKPGHASWSWPILKDDFTTLEVQKTFVDFAADMQWDYTLVDADWDQKIGYEKMQELVDYAGEKGVGILVWFNSAGDWNDTPLTPKSQLLTPEQRSAVFSKLQAMGIKGVKIDFFGGDGQSMMQYYIDLLEDAAQYNLLVNYHGATLPRGWQRTYPNLMTVEAIRGFEFRTFEQRNEDAAPPHTVMSIFTRNVFDPMDFTPMVFGDIPNIERITDNAFELAQAILMTSGIQHFAVIPEHMVDMPDYVKDLLRELPTAWDDIKFIGGHPDSHVVIARRSGRNWYVAGINGTDENKNMPVDLTFADIKSAMLIEAGDEPRSFTSRLIDSEAFNEITVKPRSGFVIVLKQ